MNFEAKLEKYAQVIVKVGVNLQPGQRLLMWNPPHEAAPLVRAVAKAAYQAGAKLVVPLYNDVQIDIAKLKYGSDESMDTYNAVIMRTVQEYVDAGDALLSIQGLPPDYLKDLDPERIKKYQQLVTSNSTPYTRAVTSNEIQWSAVRSPTQAWADIVLPDLPENERMPAFWDLVFELSRSTGENPVAGWQDHISNLSKRKDYLNEKKFTALKYSAPGTDLTVGLPAGHKWEGGHDKTKNGISYTANIPTEEVYTMPHREQVNGVVRSTKPLDYGGMLIENFSLRFENGEVVQAEAEVGEQYLKNALEVDENARLTGEVALVPNSSPISQSGIIFYDGLYDENASNHIALGSSYKSSMVDGDAMSDEEFTAAGGNISMLHLDFMIGSAEMNVDGITQSGDKEPLMRSGEWTQDL